MSASTFFFSEGQSSNAKSYSLEGSTAAALLELCLRSVSARLAQDVSTKLFSDRHVLSAQSWCFHERFFELLSLARFLSPPPRSAHVRHARNLRNPIVPWAFEWIWTSAPATAAMAFVARCWPSSTLRGSCRIAAHGMGRPHGSPSRAMDHESSMRESDGL